MSFKSKKNHEILLLSSTGSLKANNWSNLTPIKSMLAVFAELCKELYMAKIRSYILYKSISLTNVIKGKHHSNSNKLLNYLQVECRKFHNGVPSSIWKVKSPIWESIFFDFKKHVFVKAIYQLRNFDTNFISFHLSRLFL